MPKALEWVGYSFMTLDIHRPHPGVALVVTDQGSVLLGAPADAFKATKKYCADYDLPFPRELVAPQTLLVQASPQFNPEFFLYDFLFVHGQAFKPELADERLRLVLDAEQVEAMLDALRITLTGPSRQEMSGYVDAAWQPLLHADVVDALATISEHMALKKGDVPRAFEDMLEAVVFDKRGQASVLNGELTIARAGPTAFEVSRKGRKTKVDLAIHGPVVPFATLPPPKTLQTPQTFAVKPLGTRNGFDLSGPTTGFVLWVNGRAVLYDGPVGTRYLLASHGISPEDVDVIVLSHCHEDHMGAFVELFLEGYRPRVLTSEPVYRSALVKLASFFSQPVEEVAKLIDYQRVVPGTSVEVLGARFDFFYTVHSIPTIGMSVQLTDTSGITHRVQISGDTMHHEGLDKMYAEGILTPEHYNAMRRLVPDKKVDDAYFFADVGEAIIHGHPRDWAKNPNRMLYYHCPDNEHTRSFGQNLAMPGQTLTLVEPRKLHPATPGRLLSALRFLDWRDPGWFQTLLFRGTTRTAEAGEMLVDEGQENVRMSVIVSGQVSVNIGSGKGAQDDADADDADDAGREVATLGPGEFFGGIEFVTPDGRYRAEIRAMTPVELFEFDSRLLQDHVLRRGLQQRFESIWNHRPGVDAASLFARLELGDRNRIAQVAKTIDFKSGDVLIKEGRRSDSLFLLVKGRVEIRVKGKKVGEIKATDDENFFGEQSVLEPDRQHATEIRAATAGSAYRISRDALPYFFEGRAGVRYDLIVAMDQRRSS